MRVSQTLRVSRPLTDCQDLCGMCDGICILNKIPGEGRPSLRRLGHLFGHECDRNRRVLFLLLTEATDISHQGIPLYFSIKNTASEGWAQYTELKTTSYAWWVGIHIGCHLKEYTPSYQGYVMSMHYFVSKI